MQRQSRAKYISNWDFTYRLGGSARQTRFTMTAVTGHLTSTDFGEGYKRWQSVDPMALFDAPINTFIKDVSDCLLFFSLNEHPLRVEPPLQEHEPIAKNLKQEARTAEELMIWTDCDREGEHIGSEIVDVVRQVKPDIRVSRAKFSAIIPAYGC